MMPPVRAMRESWQKGGGHVGEGRGEAWDGDKGTKDPTKEVCVYWSYKEFDAKLHPGMDCLFLVVQCRKKEVVAIRPLADEMEQDAPMDLPTPQAPLEEANVRS